MAKGDVVLNLTGDVDSQIDGKTFQVHILHDNRIRLVVVEFSVDSRCPVIIGGERCGQSVGHQGKHWWAGGD